MKIDSSSGDSTAAPASFARTPKALRQPRSLLLVAAAVAAIVSFTGCSKPTAEAPKKAAASGNIKLTDAQKKNLLFYTVASSKYHKRIEANGAVDFDNDRATSVIAAFSGPVSRLIAPLGSQVRKGDPLAAVDSSDFATAIAAYRKALATARTLRQVADTDKDLLQHNGLSQREADQARTDAVNAESDSEAALQGLVSLNVDAAAIKAIQGGKAVTRVEGIIRSPIAGTVVERLVTPGQLLQAGTTPCFTVADLSRVWITAQIFGSNVTSISVGDAADIQTGVEGRNFSGKVDNIAAIVDPTTRSVGVRVVADNPGEFLRKQMYVRVLIHSAQESTGMLVPISAILRDDENLPFVYGLQSDGSFARVHVTQGYRDGDQVDITEGLRVGEQIVVNGGLFVQFMQTQ
jgi:membrane fusion protein, heavy metal efflux system